MVALPSGGKYSTAELADLFGSPLYRLPGGGGGAGALARAPAPSLPDKCLRRPAGHTLRDSNPLAVWESCGHRSRSRYRDGGLDHVDKARSDMADERAAVTCFLGGCR